MKELMMMVAVALVGAAFAQAPRESGPRPRHGGPHPGMAPLERMDANPKMAEKLGITQEQREKIDAAAKAGREQSAELQKKVGEAMKKQFELLEAEKIDEAAVMAAIDEVFELRKEIAKTQTRRVIAVRTILTPEQIKQGLELVKSMRGKNGPRQPRAEGAPGKRPHGDRPGRRRGPRDEGKPSAEKPASEM